MFGSSTSLVFILLLVAITGYCAVLVFSDPDAAKHMMGRSVAVTSEGTDVEGNGPGEVPTVSVMQEEAAAKTTRPEKISGEAAVAEDGTLTITGVKIHLSGLVLPLKPAIGLQALRAFAKAGDIYCSLLSGEPSDVRAGNCWTMIASHPVDIVAELILSGGARECVKESKGRYVSFEQMSAKDIVIPPECADDNEVVTSSSEDHDSPR